MGVSHASRIAVYLSKGSVGDSHKGRLIMREILLTQGRVALVDDEDFEWLSAWKWYAKENGKSWYAARLDSLRKPRRCIYMHHLLLDPPLSMRIDHRNHNGLDNRRQNLRICTRQQNQMNRQKQDGCSSQFKGVYWYRQTGKWRAHIKISGISQHLGYFAEEENAARAYNEAAKKLFGSFACLNEIVETDIS